MRQPGLAVIGEQMGEAPVADGLQRRTLWPRAISSRSTPRRKWALPWFQQDASECVK